MKANRRGLMNKLDVAGVKIGYTSLEDLGKAIEAELAVTEDKLGKAVKEVRRLRRARRAMRKMLGERKAKTSQAAVTAGV